MVINLFWCIIPGIKPGQVYSYPARRWRKKKRIAAPPPPGESAMINPAAAVNADEFVASAALDPVVNLGKVDPTKEKW